MGGYGIDGCREREGFGWFIETHDTNARDGIFAFCCFSQHDIGLVLGEVDLALLASCF